MVQPVPVDLRRRYLLRSRDPACRQVRIVPDIRRKVRFGRLNLMDESYSIDSDHDIIFCRNVLIYFDRPLQKVVLGRLCDRLAIGGTLFIGHSEAVTGFKLPLRQLAPTVFIRV